MNCSSYGSRDGGEDDEDDIVSKLGKVSFRSGVNKKKREKENTFDKSRSLKMRSVVEALEEMGHVVDPVVRGKVLISEEVYDLRELVGVHGMAFSRIASIMGFSAHILKRTYESLPLSSKLPEAWSMEEDNILNEGITKHYIKGGSSHCDWDAIARPLSRRSRGACMRRYAVLTGPLWRPVPEIWSFLMDSVDLVTREIQRELEPDEKQGCFSVFDFELRHWERVGHKTQFWPIIEHVFNGLQCQMQWRRIKDPHFT